MRENYLKKPVRRADRHGFALLIVLLLGVVGMLFYYFGFPPTVNKQTLAEQQKSPEKYPWVEEWRIKSSSMRKPRNITEQEPSEQQVKISQSLLSELLPSRDLTTVAG